MSKMHLDLAYFQKADLAGIVTQLVLRNLLDFSKVHQRMQR